MALLSVALQGVQASQDGLRSGRRSEGGQFDAGPKTGVLPGPQETDSWGVGDGRLRGR